MFYSITGKIVHTGLTSLAVLTGGVAFEISTSLNTLQKSGGVGNEVTLYTFLSVREDAMELFGFSTTEELDYFKMLMSVQGVGPKASLAILSVHTPQSLVFAIANNDAKSISRAQGIGNKTAQRIILELKDKVSKMIPDQVSSSDVAMPQFANGGNTSEAQSALISLGYSSSEATRAVNGIDGSLPVEEIIKLALRKMI